MFTEFLALIQGSFMNLWRNFAISSLLLNESFIYLFLKFNNYLKKIKKTVIKSEIIFLTLKKAIIELKI